jgi:hypothetical protein
VLERREQAAAVGLLQAAPGSAAASEGRVAGTLRDAPAQRTDAAAVTDGHAQDPGGAFAALPRKSLFELAKHRNVPAYERLIMTRGELIDAIRRSER